MAHINATRTILHYVHMTRHQVMFQNSTDETPTVDHVTKWWFRTQPTRHRRWLTPPSDVSELNRRDTDGGSRHQVMFQNSTDETPTVAHDTKWCFRTQPTRHRRWITPPSDVSELNRWDTDGGSRHQVMCQNSTDETPTVTHATKWCFRTQPTRHRRWLTSPSDVSELNRRDTDGGWRQKLML
jgi:hypothetical protein